MCKPSFEALKQFEPYADLDYIDFSSHLFVVKVDTDKYGFDTANDIYQTVEKCLPEGSTLIGLPKDIEFGAWSVEELDDMIDQLKAIKERIK